MSFDTRRLHPLYMRFSFPFCPPHHFVPWVFSNQTFEGERLRHCVLYDKCMMGPVMVRLTHWTTTPTTYLNHTAYISTQYFWCLLNVGNASLTRIYDPLLFVFRCLKKKSICQNLKFFFQLILLSLFIELSASATRCINNNLKPQSGRGDCS